MDESRRYSRALKRIAVLTTCGCTVIGLAPCAFAGETTSTAKTTTPTRADRELSQASDSLQQLLKSGWNERSAANASRRLSPLEIQPDQEAKSLAELIRREASAALTQRGRTTSELEQEEVPAASDDLVPSTDETVSATDKSAEATGQAHALTTPIVDNDDRLAQVRNAASASGFSMLALDCLEPPVKRSDSIGIPRSVATTIYETRMRQLARQSLQLAVHRLSNGVTDSAKRSTTEALNHIVAMLDAREGGSRHATRMAIAQDAILESSEFTSRLGAVDHDTLVRMVAVHKTTVLKHQSLEAITARHATEAYLNVAQENLAAACGSIAEASDALMLMGKVQKRMADQADTHAAAVALTYHRAAVVVDPRNAVAHRELGKTLYDQGSFEQAAESFVQSVDLQPTCETYRLLMQVAQKTGDMDTVRQCQSAINDPCLAEPLPIRHLDATSFAATYKQSASETLTLDSGNATVSARTPEITASHPADRPKSKLSPFKFWLPTSRRE